MKVFFKPTLIKDFKKLPIAIRREVHSIGVEIFPKLRDIQNGPVAHLARARAWHARGKEFESPRVHQTENCKQEAAASCLQFSVWWTILKVVRTHFAACDREEAPRENRLRRELKNRQRA